MELMIYLEIQGNIVFFFGDFCRMYIGFLLFLERGVEHGRVEILMNEPFFFGCGVCAFVVI